MCIRDRFPYYCRSCFRFIAMLLFFSRVNLICISNWPIPSLSVVELTTDHQQMKQSDTLKEGRSKKKCSESRIIGAFTDIFTPEHTGNEDDEVTGKFYISR